MRLSKKLLVASFLASATTFGLVASPSRAQDVPDVPDVVQPDSPVNMAAFGLGMSAPEVTIGDPDSAVVVPKQTISFSSSVGQSDQFNVGTSTGVSASANIAATPDYSVGSTAAFEIGANTSIIQTIGAAGDIGGDINLVPGSAVEPYIGDSFGSAGANAFSANAGAITGTFTKGIDNDANEASNNVTVGGIGSNANVAIADEGKFEVAITKVETGDKGFDDTVSASTASGGASGAVNTSTSASASSSQFVSSFVQAY